LSFAVLDLSRWMIFTKYHIQWLFLLRLRAVPFKYLYHHSLLMFIINYSYLILITFLFSCLIFIFLLQALLSCPSLMKCFILMNLSFKF